MDKQGLKETCHCGHDVTSHYLERDRLPHQRRTCLARGCECGRYTNDREPKPMKLTWCYANDREPKPMKPTW